MYHVRLSCLLFALFSLSIAFNFDTSLFEAQRGALLGRADSSSDDSDSTTSKKSTTTGKDDKNKKESATKTSSVKSNIVYDPQLPPGGISMITPAVTLGPQFYKIGDWVEFAWNYTSLKSTPKYVDVLATCTANNAMYTIAVNQTVHNNQVILWDTDKFQKTASTPLLMQTYTLIVYDAQSSPSAPARAGYLAPYNSWQFYMYTPLPYTPLSDYNCATCNAAMSSLERQTLTFVLGTCGITVLTFTIFANSFGLF